MKVQVKKAFKGCSLVTKNSKKTPQEQALHEIFFNPQYKCAAGA